jgi:hypothetical protein
LPGDDVIQKVAQAVFPASQLGAALVGYIRRPFSAEFGLVRFNEERSSVRRASQLRKFSESSVIGSEG